MTTIDADAFNAFEAAAWQRQAPGYDAFFGQITSRLTDPLLDAALVRGGGRLLDVASGPGYVAARAAERGAEVVGVDMADAMLALARASYPEIEFRHADAEALPFPDGSFDAVVANFLVLHLGRPEQVISEFARVIAPGGRLALTAWDFPERARFLGVIREAVAAAGATPPADIPAGPDIFRFSDEDEFAGLLRGAGLESVEVRTVAFTHPVASSQQLWDGLLGGTVRTAALILDQPDETRNRIRAEFDQLVNVYQRGDHLEMPVSVKLAAGRKR
ncbi:MAG TPA: methyltransferase domain-containing protein [Thermoleophilaceae bacterium]